MAIVLEQQARACPAMYAPTAMKPAWPMENCPVIPFTMLSDTARMTFTPTMRREVVRRTGELPSDHLQHRRAAAPMSDPEHGGIQESAEPRRDAHAPTPSPPRRGRRARPARTSSTMIRKPNATASRQLLERVADDELLHQPQQQPAHHRARHVADAADDRRDEGLEPDVQPHQRLHRGVLDGVEDARARGERAAQHEGQRDDPVRRDAHQRRGPVVEGDRAHRPAEARPEHQVLQPQHQRRRR